jgi:hypothetical protein
MPSHKTTKIVHSNELLPKVMMFGLFGAVIITVLIYLFSLGLSTASKAAKPPSCVRSNIGGVCYYKCTLKNGKTITVKCSGVRSNNAEEKEPKEENEPAPPPEEPAEPNYPCSPANEAAGNC